MAIALVGELSPGYEAQMHMIRALDELAISYEWLPTADIEAGTASEWLRGFSGVVMTPGTPYASLGGALEAIRHAREEDVPLFGA